jgi:GABA(A) receptor-associated protein|tara:strand:+ start:14879 stop:15271 length:393 start_codon:yes stop_codon:yes gene_type:complete
MNIFYKNTISFKNKIPSFKKKKTFQERKSESSNVITKYPDRIPIICERQGTTIQNVDKTKFLVPRDLTMGQFLYVIRKRICLHPSLGLFLFIGKAGILINNARLVSDCYMDHRDEDGFLYIKYSGENTFG